MLYQMLTTPCMLYETFELLCRHMNAMSHAPIASRLCQLHEETMSPHDQQMLIKDAELLDKVSRSICSDIDVHDDELNFYLSNFKVDWSNHFNCVARVMLYSFFALIETDYYEQAEKTKYRWKLLQENGYKILEFNPAGMYICESDESFSRSLFDQIYELVYPAEAKLDAYRVLSDHENHMDRLVLLMEPYYKRLMKHMDELMPLYERRRLFWMDYLDKHGDSKFSNINPSIESSCKQDRKNMVNVGIFLYNAIGWGDVLIGKNGESVNSFYIGLAIQPERGKLNTKNDGKKLVNAIRALSDESRLSLLRRLSESSSYCLELANETDSNPGNVSRNLNMLFAEGLLVKERKNARTYYRTDLDALSETLKNVEKFIKSK